MGKKLKAISKVSVALALLGAAVPAVEAAPTVMAAKKTTKKTKKSTKKSVKKSTKKAKKAKKSTKKKSTKKVAKTTLKKVAKKTVKKVVKKPTVKKVIKHVTMADKYQPQVKSSTVKVDWGTNLAYYQGGNRPEDFITNKSSLPSNVDFEYLDPVDTQKGGTYKTRIQAKYSDGSKEVVGTVSFVVPVMESDMYQPTVQDVTLNYGDPFDPRNDAITNAPGYFPNDPALSQFENDGERTSFSCTGFNYLGLLYPDNKKPGTYTAQIKVTYPDGSYEDTKKFKITVLPSEADKAKVSLKGSRITVSSDEALEHEIDNEEWPFNYTLNNPSHFLKIDSSLPEGTVIRFTGDLDSDDTPKAGKEYVTSLAIYFPDDSKYETDKFIVKVK